MSKMDCLKKWTKYNHKLIFNLPCDDKCKTEYTDVAKALYEYDINSISILNISNNLYTLQYKDQGSPILVKIDISENSQSGQKPI